MLLHVSLEWELQRANTTN